MNKSKAEILYRTSRYGQWKHLEIDIPEEVKIVREYVVEYLKENEINYLQMQVIKVSKL